MRRFLILLASFTSIGSLSACGPAATDWPYTPLENFDPAQVSMLPANPYTGTARAAELSAPQPRAPAAVSSRR